MTQLTMDQKHERGGGGAIHYIPLSLRGKGVLHVHQCFSEGFRWLVGDVEIIGS